MPVVEDFSSLFELLPVGAYRALPDGRWTRANAAMARIFGLPGEAEVLAAVNEAGRTWYVDPARRDAFRAQLAADGAVRQFVAEMERVDTGERYWISENAHGVRDAEGRLLYYEGTVEDITARRAAEESLQLTLDNAGRGIARVDAAGRLVLFNEEMAQLLELPRELLASRPLASELIAFQEQRGDFGEGNEHIDPAVRADYDAGAAVSITQGLLASRSYLRPTRSGRILEISSRSLPDGSVVRTYSDVTAYIEATRLLADKSRALRITLDSMSQGICAVDAEGRAFLSNARHQELLDLPAAFMATQPTHAEVVQFQIARGDFGESFALVDTAARGYVSAGDKVPPIQGPETYIRHTRDGRTLEVRTRPLPDGGVVRTFTDVTAYLQAQEALAARKAQLAALINAMPERVWFKDAQGVFRLANAAEARYQGLREQQILGRTSDELFGPEVGAQHRETDMLAMQSTGPVLSETRRTSRVDGVTRDMEVTKIAMRDDAGRCIGILGIVRDITARKRAEAALIAARDAAEAGERAKAQALASMGQDLRTLTDGIVALAGQLLAGGLDPAQREAVERIRDGGMLLQQRVGDPPPAATDSAARAAPGQAAVDVVACAEAALAAGGAGAAAKGIELLCLPEDDLPAHIVGDAARLHQVIANLVHNAVKFSDHGEVLLTLALRSANRARPHLHVAVADTGCGIPPERMDRLFQVFSELGGDRAPDTPPGAGLGLATCRQLVASMGGRIWVTSAPGAGSTFEFEIPCDVAPGATAHAAPSGLEGRRVLLVDDSARARMVVSTVLRRLGLDVAAVPGIAEACDALRAGPVDAVLLDAPAAARAARDAQAVQRAAGAPVPVLLLVPGGASAGAGLPAVAKPLQRDALREALAALLAAPAAAA